jgi:hypothetical protein
MGEWRSTHSVARTVRCHSHSGNSFIQGNGIHSVTRHSQLCRYSENKINWYIPREECRTYDVPVTALTAIQKRHDNKKCSKFGGNSDAPPSELRSMHGTWTKPSVSVSNVSTLSFQTNCECDTYRSGHRLDRDSVLVVVIRSFHNPTKRKA